VTREEFADVCSFYQCQCISADARQNCASGHNTQTELEKLESSAICCFWKHHLEEPSTEEVGLLEAVLRVFPNYLSGLARLGRHAHFAAERNSSGDEDDDDLWAR